MLLELIKSKTLLDEDYIKETCLNSNALYSSFYLPKKNGKLRKIYHPHKELKALQRILHDNILAYLKVHSASMAYSPSSSIKRNAEKHSKNKFLLRMDFRSFFESISSKDVFQLCEKKLSNQFDGWDRFDSDMFTRFVCYKNSLVMGAVTSPAIANLILYEFDDSLSTFCSSIGVTYTRYADDMYFSTNTRNLLNEVEGRVYKIVEQLQLPNNLKVNISKTYHSSKSRRRLVTGLVLTCEGGVSLGRRKKREIRSLIFNWESLADKEKQSLSGYLSYAKSIEPEFINRLCMKYGANIVKDILEYAPE